MHLVSPLQLLKMTWLPMMNLSIASPLLCFPWFWLHLAYCQIHSLHLSELRSLRSQCFLTSPLVGTKAQYLTGMPNTADEIPLLSIRCSFAKNTSSHIITNMLLCSPDVVAYTA